MLVCPSGNLVLGVEVLPQEFSTCPSMVCWVQGSLAQQDIRRVVKPRVHRPPGMDTQHECSCHKHCASFLVCSTLHGIAISFLSGTVLNV